MMGTAIGRGEHAAVDAARQAINSPLLEDSRISGARGILINITGSSRLGLHEVNEACTIIREAAECDDVQINFGVTMNESMADAVKITVIATGFQPHSLGVIEEPKVAAPVFAPQLVPEPVAVAMAPDPAPEVEPEPAVFDSEDLDTPAYLRQGRLLN
jgi:cell division protein FtsZ